MAESIDPYLSDIIVPGKTIQDISDINPLRPRYIRPRSGDFTDSTLSSRLCAIAENSFYLLPEPISGISLPAGDTVVTLREIEGLDLGRNCRRSTINFGQFAIRSELGNQTELVAAKYSSVIPATREFVAGQMLNHRLGDTYHTHPPIGFIGQAEKTNKIATLTRYNHFAISIDNTLWNQQSTPEQRLAAMALAGTYLARIHNLGIIHGDAQAKNIAHNSLREPHFIDLEGALDISREDAYYQVIHRMCDIDNFFDPETSPTDASVWEIVTFADSYIEEQRGNACINGKDIKELALKTQSRRKRKQ